jgi:hypothetical protein
MVSYRIGFQLNKNPMEITEFLIFILFYSSYLFSAFDFSLSSHALINDILFSVATRASTASEENSELIIYSNDKLHGDW